MVLEQRRSGPSTAEVPSKTSALWHQKWDGPSPLPWAGNTVQHLRAKGPDLLVPRINLACELVPAACSTWLTVLAGWCTCCRGWAHRSYGYLPALGSESKSWSTMILWFWQKNLQRLLFGMLQYKSILTLGKKKKILWSTHISLMLK